MRKSLKYLWIFLPIIVVGIAAAKNHWLDSNQIILPSGEKISSEELQSQAVLETIAAQINQALPKEVDGETELRSVEGRDGELMYNYIKVNASSDQFDSNEFVERMSPKAIALACNSPDLYVFLENGVNARYAFHGSDLQPIGEILVTPSQCGS